MKKLIHWLAIIFTAEMGVLHFINAQSRYEQAVFIGYLYIAIFLGALIAAYGIYRNFAWGWLLGIFVSLSSIANYIWAIIPSASYVTVITWQVPFEFVSAALGVGLIVMTFFKPWQLIAAEGQALNWQRYALPVFGLLVMALGSYGTSQWDIYASEVGYHEHVGSVSAVCSTPLTTFAELEEKYGIRVSLVAVSMMDSVVDVRLKIIDPDKAHALLVNQAALLVNQQSLVLAPHLHSHWKFKPGGTFVMFFSTQRDLIRSGSEVSLVFGHVRIEPVTVK